MKSFYFGVLGWPIQHSISPLIFQFLSQKLQVSLDYRRVELPPEQLDPWIQILKSTRLFQGLNVTLPFKEKVLIKLDQLSPAARAIGAVNVIEVGVQGRLRGHNTDVIGIEKTFLEQRVSWKGEETLIFGAGGAALSVGYVLGQMKARRVHFVNRDIKRAELQAKKLRLCFPKTEFTYSSRTPQWDEIQPALYVNATPVGMKGFPKRLPLPAKLTPQAMAFDLVYRPIETAFLQAARQQGLKAVGGLDMLMWQALASWEIWIGKLNSPTLLKKSLKKHLMEKVDLSQ